MANIPIKYGQVTQIDNDPLWGHLSKAGRRRVIVLWEANGRYGRSWLARYNGHIAFILLFEGSYSEVERLGVYWDNANNKFNQYTAFEEIPDWASTQLLSPQEKFSEDEIELATSIINS